MRRGEQEQKCLDKVKKIINAKNFFPYPNGDTTIFENISTAKANEQANSFPDFVCKNGFIEHFQVSVSKETKKGSSYKQKLSAYERERDARLQALQEEHRNSEFKPNTITTYDFPMIYEENSYAYFVDSFKKNFENHIESLKKYVGQKGNGAFLVEQTDGSLYMEGTYSTVPYAISGDKELLEYLYSFKDFLTYLLFIDGERLEIIKLSLIPEILPRARQEIKCKAGRMISSRLLCCIDLG